MTDEETKTIEALNRAGVVAREDGSVSQAINFRFATNSGAVRQETWKGREFIVVPGYTLPFGIVMNRILYPEDEIRSGFNSLEDTIAPYDHPYDEQGNPVPAKSTDGLVKHHIGAYNRNVRVDGNRVYLEKWIDKAVAVATEHGMAVLNAVAQGKPLETSTGLNFRPIMQAGNSGGKEYDMVATNMAFDHDAILPPGTPGAARPADGVGMLVNCVNCAQFDEGEYIAANAGLLERMIMSVNLDVKAGRGNSWAQEKLSEALQAKYPSQEYGVWPDDFDESSVMYCIKDADGKRKSFMLKYAITGDKVELSGEPVEVERKVSFIEKAVNAMMRRLSAQKSVVESTLNTNTTVIDEECEMTKEEIEALVQSALNAQKEQFDAEIGKRDAQISSLTAAVEATNSAKRAELETAVVASGLLDAANAKALPFEALDALAAKLKGVDASKFSTNSSDEPQGLSFDL